MRSQALAVDRLMIPPGYAITDSFSSQGGIVSVTAGAGVGATPAITIVERDIPPGAKAYIRALSIRVVDMAAYDQLIFQMRRNGGLQRPWDAVSGEQITEDFLVPVDETFDAGHLEVTAKNISGTTETGAAGAALDVRVIGRFIGYLLSPVRI